jgi:hypothetical protein
MRRDRNVQDDWGVRVQGYAHRLGVRLTMTESANLAYDLRDANGTIPVDPKEAVRQALIRLGRLQAAA